jgi:hypothetical protein
MPLKFDNLEGCNFSIQISDLGIFTVPSGQPLLSDAATLIANKTTEQSKNLVSTLIDDQFKIS